MVVNRTKIIKKTIEVCKKGFDRIKTVAMTTEFVCLY